MANFSDWLTKELARRDMSPAKLARLMNKKDQGVISRILSGERNPSNETIKAIAKALKVSERSVFEAAGVIPPAVGNAWAEDMAYKLNQINTSLRPVAEAMIDGLLTPTPDLENLIKRLERLQVEGPKKK